MLLRDLGHVSGLTASDLRFEWILSLCMVLALGAVFSPLFILLGLREGVVGNILDDLRHDPASRLVTPKFPVNQPFDEAWLRTLGGRAHSLIASSTSHLLLDVEGIPSPVNAVPTSADDPLMAEHGITVPEGRPSLVISQRLAGKLGGRQAGDRLTLVLVRTTDREERVPLHLPVAAVLPGTASPDFKLWLPLDLFEQLHAWRRGQAVPQLGLSGGGATLVPEYDGILTLLPRVPSDADYRRMLAGRIAFSTLPEPLAEPPWTPPAESALRLWRAVNSRVYEDDLRPLEHRHHEQGYHLEASPYVEPFPVQLVSYAGRRELRLAVLPDTHGDAGTGIAAEAAPPLVRVALDDGCALDNDATLSLTGAGDIQLQLPVRVLPSALVRPGFALVAPGLAGRLSAARRQPALYDPASGTFRPASTGRHFFRAYAPGIEGLENLVEYVRQEGLRTGAEALREPVSRVEEVRRVRRLAGYMEQLYLLIAVVSGISGFFAIVANVYAGVQRRRRDLAYLQLLGVHPLALFLFPLLKSLALVAGGILAALAAYGVFAHFAVRLLHEALGGAASLTRLTAPDIAVLVAAILATATFASLLAATAVARIEPAEYIRE